MKTINRQKLIIAWLDNEMSDKDLVKMFNICYATLWRYSKQLELPARKMGRKKINLEG